MLKYHIQTIEVGSSGIGDITFNNIPSDYTDLVFYLSLRDNRAITGGGFGMRINGSADNFTHRFLEGNGSTTTSGSGSGAFPGNSIGASSTANTFGSIQLYISNYRSSLAKSISIEAVTEQNATAAFQQLLTNLWNSTAAVTSVSFWHGSNLFVQNSSVSLYGIKRGSDGATGYAPIAYGGTITTSGGYTYHTFTSSGTFIPAVDLSVDYFLLGGGGGGAGTTSQPAGGGGSGYITSGTMAAPAGSNYAVTVGAGGAGTAGGVNQSGGAGTASTFASFSASPGNPGTLSNFGSAGGSGGGGNGAFPGGFNGSNGQGNGGAGSGVPLPSWVVSLRGASTPGGLYGGGQGGTQDGAPAAPANSGAGGQSGIVWWGGGSAGSGIVIIRYLTPA
jgi:hypothetical protein